MEVVEQLRQKESHPYHQRMSLVRSDMIVLVVLFCIIGVVYGSKSLNVSSRSSISSSDYGTVLAQSMFFYEAQKSGPASGKISWRGDATMKDGGGALRGGFYDAGDHVKFVFPMAFTLTLLSWGALESPNGYSRTGQMPAILDHLKFGCDFLLACWDSKQMSMVAMVGDPNLDHSWWIAAEIIDVLGVARPVFRVDKTHPGTEVACEAAAALASASIVFDRFGGASKAYISDLRTKSAELYNFGTTYQGNYSRAVPLVANFYNSFSGFIDEMGWSAAWLYLATKNNRYRDDAIMYYGKKPPSPGWVLNWDDKSYGLSFLIYDIAKQTKNQALLTRAQQNINADRQFWMSQVPKLDGIVGILDKWGSLRYAATSSFLSFLWSKRTGSVENFNFAKKQIDYILGDNPHRFSFVVGYGSNSPKNPHHRGAHGPYGDTMMDNPKQTRHVLYGALVGGPTGTSFSTYSDRRDNYITNEVALDYNAGLTGALAFLAQFYKSPRAKFPRIERIGDSFIIKVTTSTISLADRKVKIMLRQISGWPAQRMGFVARYYVALNKDLTNIQIRKAGGSGSVSSFKRTSSHLGYFEVTWTASEAPFPATMSTNYAEVEVAMNLPNGAHWPRLRDPSSTGGTHLPIFSMSGQRLFGMTPTGVGSPPRPSAKPSVRPRPTASSKPKPPRRSTPPKPKPPRRSPPPKPSKNPKSSRSPKPPTQRGPLQFIVASHWLNGDGTLGFTASGRVPGARPGDVVSFQWSSPTEIINVWNCEEGRITLQTFTCKLLHGPDFGLQASTKGVSRPPSPKAVKVQTG